MNPEIRPRGGNCHEDGWYQLVVGGLVLANVQVQLSSAHGSVALDIYPKGYRPGCVEMMPFGAHVEVGERVISTRGAIRGAWLRMGKANPDYGTGDAPFICVEIKSKKDLEL